MNTAKNITHLVKLPENGSQRDIQALLDLLTDERRQLKKQNAQQQMVIEKQAEKIIELQAAK